MIMDMLLIDMCADHRLISLPEGFSYPLDTDLVSLLHRTLPGGKRLNYMKRFYRLCALGRRRGVYASVRELLVGEGKLHHSRVRIFL